MATSPAPAHFSSSSGKEPQSRLPSTVITHRRRPARSSQISMLPGTQFGQLNVTGSATVNGGSLAISLQNGFEPALGQSFAIINASSVTGQFATVESMGRERSHHLSANLYR